MQEADPLPSPVTKRHCRADLTTVRHVRIVARILDHGRRSLPLAELRLGYGKRHHLTVGQGIRHLDLLLARKQRHQCRLSRGRGTRSGGVTAPQREEAGHEALDLFAKTVAPRDGDKPRRHRRTADGVHGNAQLMRRLYLIDKAPRLATLLRQYGLRTHTLEQRLIAARLVIDDPLTRETLPLSQRERRGQIEDAEDARVVCLPIRPQPTDGLHAGQGQQSRDTVRLHPTDGIVVIIAPNDVRTARRIDALVTYHRQRESFGHDGHRAMQHLGEGMGGVDQQPDLLLPTERLHRLLIHRTREAGAMMAIHLLVRVARGIEIGTACLVGRLHGGAPLGRPPKDQDHGRKRCLKSDA